MASEPDDAPITPGSRRRRPRRIAAAEEDSDGEGAVTPAADEVAAEFMRLATTCSSDGTPTGPWHGGGDGASRPWHGGGDLVGGAEAQAGTEPDPAQIEVHELKIAPQPQHVRACLRAGRRGGASANEATRCLGRSRARATPAGLRRAWLHAPAPASEPPQREPHAHNAPSAATPTSGTQAGASWDGATSWPLTAAPQTSEA
eukprot:scaffold107933_cov63-Phaeocystis_antarctica.AAC.6